MTKTFVLFFIGIFCSFITLAQDNKGEKAENNENQPTLSVVIKGLQDEQLMDNAEAFLAIYKVNGNPIKNLSYTDYLANSGIEQIKLSLQPFGYYSSSVTMTNDKQDNQWTVTYDVDKGKPTRTNTVDLVIDGEGSKLKEYKKLITEFEIKTGDILEQEYYKDFKNDATSLSTTYGYFDADFTDKRIIISDDYKNADIHVKYDTGQRYRFGKSLIKQDFLDQDVFERFISYQEGQLYSSKDVADVQRDLYNSNYVKTIDIASNPNSIDKTVPIEFTIKPKANKKHTFSIGYGTDTGARGSYIYDWRWVNRRGHQFKTNLYAAQKKQEFGFEYRIPAQKPATDYYKIFGNVNRDHAGNKESLIWNLGGAYQDKIGNWEREFGLKWQREDFTLGNDSGNIGLLTPYTKFTYRKTDNPLNTSRGLWMQGIVTGAHENALSDVSFLQAIASAKIIHRFTDQHKTKISGAVGKTWVSDFHQLPAAYRFFTGGDRTIRGYKFNSIGSRDSSTENIGGDNMYYLSGEYEYFFKENMAAAAFIDIGDAYSTGSFSAKIGAGLGFHYYSPIGPIRIDVAHGFDKPGDDVRLHLNIGPEF